MADPTGRLLGTIRVREKGSLPHDYQVTTRVREIERIADEAGFVVLEGTTSDSDWEFQFQSHQRLAYSGRLLSAVEQHQVRASSWPDFRRACKEMFQRAGSSGSFSLEGSGTVEDIRRHSPATSLAPDQFGIVVASFEELLMLAERYIDDPANPQELKQLVDGSKRQLRIELDRQERVRNAVIGPLVGELVAIVMPDFAIEVSVAPRTAEALGHLDDVTQELAGAETDGELQDSGEKVIAALEDVEDAIAEEDSEDETPVESLRIEARTGLGMWLRHDLQPTINAFIAKAVGVVEPAAAGAGTTYASATKSLPLLAGTLVAVSVALLRSRFPWIFRPSNGHTDDADDVGQ